VDAPSGVDAATPDRPAQRARIFGRIRDAAPRCVVATALITGAVGGATVGAAMDPAHDLRYTAEALVVGGIGSGERPLRRLQAAIRLPSVRAAMRETTPSASRDMVVETRLDGASGILRLEVHERSPTQATKVADALLREGLRLLRIARARGPIVVGDFEVETNVWLAGPRLFAASPKRVERIAALAKFGRYALHAVCPATPGCGPSVRIRYPFKAQVRYTATGWIRSPDDETQMTMVLGGSPQDVAQASAQRLDRPWRRYAVSWVPKAPSPFAEITFQTAERRAASFIIDGVALSDESTTRPPPPGTGAEAAAFRRPSRFATFSAIPTGELNASTPRSTLLGAALGTLSGLGAFALWILARRHQ
jgi:hypothetical protein